MKICVAYLAVRAALMMVEQRPVVVRHHTSTFTWAGVARTRRHDTARWPSGPKPCASVTSPVPPTLPALADPSPEMLDDGMICFMAMDLLVQMLNLLLI